MPNNKQKKLEDFKELRPLSLELQLMMEEAQRKRLFDELLKNLTISEIRNGKQSEACVREKASLCKIFLYQTKPIDEKINEIRQLMLKK